VQNEVSALSPRVAFLDQQRTILTVGNSHLKQRIAALAQDKIFKDGKCALISCLNRTNVTEYIYTHISFVLQLIKRR
jgi:hypothetical protein